MSTSSWVKPAIAEDVAPKAVEVEPIVTVEFANLAFAIDPVSIEFSTEPAEIVKAPPAATVASPEMFAKIASSRFEKVIFFSVPLSEKTKWSWVWWSPVPPNAL